MGVSDLFLASIVVFAILGIASATIDIECSIGLGHGPKRYNSGVVRIEGRIYCLIQRPTQNEEKLLPIQGASARVSCLAKDENGNTQSFVVKPETDEKGYYVTNLTENTPEGYTLDTQKCIVTIGTPAPNSDCIIMTNINNGVSAVLLSSLNPTTLPDNSILYSLNPFSFRVPS